MYVSIHARKLNDDNSLVSNLSVDSDYEFSFGHYTGKNGAEKLDYTSFWLRGHKTDSQNIAKDFEIEMSPAEISEFVDFVIRNKLVTFHAETTYRDH